MWLLILFFFGLAVGSFLNVVSLRYKPGERLFFTKNIGGRSYCPRCNKKLGWAELIPLVSFIIQRRHCRSCSKKISFQYPVVELITASIFLLVPLRILNFYPFEQSLVKIYLLSGFWIVVFLTLLLIAIVDKRFFIIPDQVNIFLASMGVAGIWLFQISSLKHFSTLFYFSENVFLNHLFGGIFGLLFFALIVLITRGKGMGMGDVKLAGALGLIFGLPDIILLIALSFIVGSIASIPFLIRGGMNLKTAVPFGPFLGISAILVFFSGFEIVSWYFSSIQLFWS